MRATLNLPPSVRLIEAALEGLVQVNRVLIETRAVPPSPLDANVRYKREGSGLEEWDNALTCMRRGWGDCEDLNAWECARINIDEDPEAICALMQTGRRMFHCIVLLSSGEIVDVCPSLGMTVPGTSLEGIPWVETRAENIIGATPYRPKPSGAPRLSERQRRIARARRSAYGQANLTRPKPNAYNPRASDRTQSSTSEPYQPASSRSGRGSQDPTVRDPMQEPTTAPNTTTDPLAMVSPTSASTPEGNVLLPMLDVAEEMDELDEMDEEAEDEGEGVWP